MSGEKQQVLDRHSTAAGDETELGTTSYGSVGVQTRRTHYSTVSPPHGSASLHVDLKPPGSKERTTWGGTGEKLHNKHQLSRLVDNSSRSYQEYVPSGGMYVLYEDQNITKTGEDSDALSNASHLERSVQSDGGASERDHAHDTFIGEIDGRYSFSGAEDFVRLEVNADTTSTSQELMECKETVLRPYLIFLKVIGWRRFQEAVPDLNRNRLNFFYNLLYPMILLLVLVATIITQNLTCFLRTQPANYRTDNQSHLRITCDDHIVSNEVIADILILTAYLYGIYIFRFGEPEHLAAMMETVFLSNSQQMSVKKKRIIGVLRSYLALGLFWILLDFSMNILRLYSQQLLDWDSFIPALRIPPDKPFNGTTRHTPGENALRYIFSLFSLGGFVVYNMLYYAVVVTYASQSQLIQYYVISIIDKVRTKAYSLEDAIKDIRQTYTYLQVINSKLSTLTTLMLFLFLPALLSSIYKLAQFPEKDTLQNTPIFYVGVIVGLGNIFQWGLLAAVPLIQAARLTSCCRQLRRLGLEIGSRPFVYAGTPQLDLQYFMQYTNSTRYTAKLGGVPIYPSFVMGFVFLGGVIGLFVISINNYFVFARWF